MNKLNVSKYYILNLLVWVALLANFFFVFYMQYSYNLQPKSSDFTYYISDITFYYFCCFLIYLFLILAFFTELILRKFNKIQSYNKLELSPSIRRIIISIGLLSIPISAFGFYLFVYIASMYSMLLDLLHTI